MSETAPRGFNTALAALFALTRAMRGRGGEICGR